MELASFLDIIRTLLWVPLGVVVLRSGQGENVFKLSNYNDGQAVASASSVDEAPWCLMSRSKGDGKVAQGGRFTRFSRYYSISLVETT